MTRTAMIIKLIPIADIVLLAIRSQLWHRERPDYTFSSAAGDVRVWELPDGLWLLAYDQHGHTRYAMGRGSETP